LKIQELFVKPLLNAMDRSIFLRINQRRKRGNKMYQRTFEDY